MREILSWPQKDKTLTDSIKIYFSYQKKDPTYIFVIRDGMCYILKNE